MLVLGFGSRPPCVAHSSSTGTAAAPEAVAVDAEAVDPLAAGPDSRRVHNL